MNTGQTLHFVSSKVSVFAGWTSFLVKQIDGDSDIRPEVESSCGTFPGSPKRRTWSHFISKNQHDSKIKYAYFTFDI